VRAAGASGNQFLTKPRHNWPCRMVRHSPVSSGGVSRRRRRFRAPVARAEERQRFCTQYLPKDYRNLIFFVEDGAANDWFGVGSSEAYIRDGLGLDPEMVDWAVAGLRRLRPDEPVELNVAVTLGKHGGDRRSEQARAEQADNVGPDPTFVSPGAK
jgi:hypothetical protein